MVPEPPPLLRAVPCRLSRDPGAESQSTSLKHLKIRGANPHDHKPRYAGRGPRRIIPAPARQTTAPIKSHRSGLAPSTAHNQPIAETM